MNIDDKSLLVAFTGADTSLPAVDYGIWLAQQIGVPVNLLGIVEKPARRKRVEEIINSKSAYMETIGILYQTRVESGHSREVICRLAVPDRHLTVFSSFDRPLLRRWLRGRSFRRILQEIDTPVLYVRQMHAELRKILVCMGGLGHAQSAVIWALTLAHHMEASVTLLHVVEPISYAYPISQRIQGSGDDILQTETPQGQNLREALEHAQKMGVQTSFQVRHGDIVHEIITEVNTRSYDLIVMGSPYSSKNLRHLFMPNVTAEIAETVICPVLVASTGQEWIFIDLPKTNLEEI